jgi:hypothetical protein
VISRQRNGYSPLLKEVFVVKTKAATKYYYIKKTDDLASCADTQHQQIIAHRKSI